MDRDSRNAAIAALCIILVFGTAAYNLPRMMLAAGSVSAVLAGIVVVIFLFGFFAVFWLRSRSQNKNRDK